MDGIELWAWVPCPCYMHACCVCFGGGGEEKKKKRGAGGPCNFGFDRVADVGINGVVVLHDMRMFLESMPLSQRRVYSSVAFDKF